MRIHLLLVVGVVLLVSGFDALAQPNDAPAQSNDAPAQSNKVMSQIAVFESREWCRGLAQAALVELREQYELTRGAAGMPGYALADYDNHLERQLTQLDARVRKYHSQKYQEASAADTIYMLAKLSASVRDTKWRTDAEKQQINAAYDALLDRLRQSMLQHSAVVAPKAEQLVLAQIEPTLERLKNDCLKPPYLYLLTEADQTGIAGEFSEYYSHVVKLFMELGVRELHPNDEPFVHQVSFDVAKLLRTFISEQAKKGAMPPEGGELSRWVEKKDEVFATISSQLSESNAEEKRLRVEADSKAANARSNEVTEADLVAFRQQVLEDTIRKYGPSPEPRDRPKPQNLVPPEDRRSTAFQRLIIVNGVILGLALVIGWFVKRARARKSHE